MMQASSESVCHNQNPSELLLLRATIKDARDVHERVHESQSGHKLGLPRQIMWCTRLGIHVVH